MKFLLKKNILVGIAILNIQSQSSALFIKKEIAVIGTGYVGLVLGACLAEFGHSVVCADIDKSKITLLNSGKLPIFEPGLENLIWPLNNNYKMAPSNCNELQGLIAKNIKMHTLSFTDLVDKAIQEASVIFIAVGTPMDAEGTANLSAIRAVGRKIGENLNAYKVICTKSTVPVGTGEVLKRIITAHSKGVYPFDVVSNPEFLREGSAVKDFLEPDRVIFGLESENALQIMYDIYEPLRKKNIPFLVTDIPTAETIKYASNAFLAVKIAYINEIANLCDAVRANIELVSKGMGLDPRIGSSFLKPGPGFGGSCFPKDAQALLFKARSEGVNLNVLEAALNANEEQKVIVFNKIKNMLKNDLENKTVSILGLAFKANTDDIRYSSAITIIDKLINHKAIVKAYDPAANENMSKQVPSIIYASSIEDCVQGADCIVILTEWDEFRKMNLEKIRQLVNQPYIVDARNILSTPLMDALGFTYTNLGNALIS